MISAGSSPDSLLMLSVVILTLYYNSSLFSRTPSLATILEYSVFIIITKVVWVIFSLNLMLCISLSSLPNNDLKSVSPSTESFSYLFGVYNTLLPVSGYQALFVWESWLVVDSYSYPFAYTFLTVIMLSFINCLSYHRDDIRSFALFLKLITFAGVIVLTSNSMIVFFLAYETLLIPSFMILYKFAKSRRCIEAAYAMFFWTQFGALLIILAFFYTFQLTMSHDFTLLSVTMLRSVEVNFLFGLLFFGFGVKFPIWPFYGWLPKAHVEASANFSIFLSGVLVKFAFFWSC